MTKDEFMKLEEADRQNILFIMATDDIDTALDRWNMLCVASDDEDEDYLEFDVDTVTDQLGTDIAKEMDERIRTYLTKIELAEKRKKDAETANEEL